MFMIVLSWVLIIFMAFILKRFLIRGEHPALIMELPPYRRPNLKTISRTLWERIKIYLKRAITIIIIISIMIWALSYFPNFGADVNESYAGQLGEFLSPIGGLMGFSALIMVSLAFGFLAKEVSISTLAILYTASGASLGVALASVWTPLTAFTFIIVQMIYLPCLASVVTMKKETGSYKWTLFGLIFSLFLAFSIGTIIYQIGILLGF